LSEKVVLADQGIKRRAQKVSNLKYPKDLAFIELPSLASLSLKY
jgi:hypothetical protein